MEGVLASLRCLFRQTGEKKAQTCAKAIFRHLPTERKEISGEYPIDSLAGCAKKGIPKTRRTEGRNLPQRTIGPLFLVTYDRFQSPRSCTGTVLPGDRRQNRRRNKGPAATTSSGHPRPR